MVLRCPFPGLKAAAALIMHWLSHATRMRRGGGDCQCHWGKSAHEQQNEQQSGGQAVHDRFAAERLWPGPSHRSRAVRAQVSSGFRIWRRVRLEKSWRLKAA